MAISSSDKITTASEPTNPARPEKRQTGAVGVVGRFGEAADVAISEKWSTWTDCQQGVSDSELLQVYQLSGSTEAISLLIHRHAPLVSSVVRRLIMNPQDAEDAFQATFIVLMLRAKKIRKPNSLASWLYGVAYRTARRVRSARRKENEKMQSQSSYITETNASTHEPATSPEEDPLSILARDLQLEALDQELSRLPKHLREPLIEHYLCGRSVPEIAEVMSLSVSAIEGRMKRGRRALRTQLAMRGVSLSIVASACTRFQKEVVASTAEPWSTRLLDQYVDPSNAPSVSELQSALHNNSHPLFDLVRGEMIMSTLSKTTLGIAGAGLCLATLFTVGVVSAFGDPKTAATATRKTELVSETSQDAESMDQPVVLAQMGGIGGGGGGMGGTPSVRPSSASEPTKPVTVVWQKPQGASPFWLKETEDEESRKIEEGLRQMLNKRVECKFDAVPLFKLLGALSEETGVDILIDDKGLEEENVTREEPIVYIRRNPVKVRDALAQILKTLQLTYIIERESLVITSLSRSADTVRYYDLSFVLPDSSLVDEVLSSLQTTIDPDCWQAAGGSSTITVVGSMLIVNCPEGTHTNIESFLRAISKQSATNLKPTSTSVRAVPGAMAGQGGMM